MKINLPSKRVLTVGVLLILSCSVRAQESRKSVAGSEEGKLLQQLIGEVRELRRELQEVGLNSYRAQLAIERLKFQQSRVGTLTRQLEENENELNSLDSAKKQLSARINDIELQPEIKGEDNTQRTQRENELNEVKKALEYQVERESFLNDHRTKLEDRLRVEQAELDSLNRELLKIESDFRKVSDNAASYIPRP